MIVRSVSAMVCALALAAATSTWAAEGDLPNIPHPQIPDHQVKLTDFGAVGDGKTDNTAAIEKAIAAVEQAGGGTLEVPEGDYLTGRFALKSHFNLHLDKGATIKFEGPAENAFTSGGRMKDYLTADNCTDIAITGEGTIDGQGSLYWDRYKKRLNPATGKREEPTGMAHRPFMVVMRNCERVLVQGVTFTNSPMFHLVPQQCRNVVIDGAHFKAPADAPNTDALDPAGWNFLITNCTFDVGDDCIAVKASARDGTPEKPSCENFTVTNCTFKHGHGLSVGGQTNGCMKNMTVRDCTFEDTEAGIRLKAGRGSGGLVENLTYENLKMKGVKVAIYITSYYPKEPKDVAAVTPQPMSASTPIWKDIVIKNVTAEGGDTAGLILGLPEAPVENIQMQDVHISARKGMQVVFAKGIKFENSTIEATDGKPLTVEKADVEGLQANGQ